MPQILPICMYPWAPCLFLAIIKERYEENFGYQYMCNSPAAPSPQSSISDPFSWAIIHSPRPILRLIRWCSIRRVLWWPEQPSSAKSFHLTHPMWLWYMRMTYSCSDAQGGSGNAKSSKKNAQSTRLGELHIWGTPPLTRSFIMAKNRQGDPRWQDGTACRALIEGCHWKALLYITSKYILVGIYVETST